MATENNGIAGHGIATVYGPDGEIKEQVPFKNLITDYGDEVYATRGIGTGEDVSTGMRLGTGTTAVSKAGAGAAIVTYVSGSSKAFDATFPSLSDKGTGVGHRITHQTTWDAGEATDSALAEVVITNIAIADVAGAAGNTISRALLDPVVNKGADDTLEIEWHHDFLGA